MTRRLSVSEMVFGSSQWLGVNLADHACDANGWTDLENGGFCG